MAGNARRLLCPVVIAATTLTLASCGDAVTDVKPMEIVPPVTSPDDGGSGSGGADGGQEGDFTLLTPGTNLVDYGAVGPFRVVDYGADDFVYVRVTGTITSVLAPCEPGDPAGTFGPWGDPRTGAFYVRILDASGHPLSTDPSTQGTSIKVARDRPGSPGTVMVARNGGGSTCLVPLPDGTYLQVAGLMLFGSQNVHYEVYPVGTVAASPTWLIKGGVPLLNLLRAERDGTMPISPSAEMEMGDEEAYSEYIMLLVRLVERYDLAEATPLLARWSVGFSNGSRFQSAEAGDAAVGWVSEAWENEYLRPGATVTFGLMVEHARISGAVLADESMGVIRQHLLLAAVDDRPETRHAFTDATRTAMDPAYLPLLQALSASDDAQIDGRRYVSIDAGVAAELLGSARAEASFDELLTGTLETVESACAIGWITNQGVCNGLATKLRSAERSMGRGQEGAARNQLRAFLQELEAQHGNHVQDSAFTLLASQVEYLIGRIS